MLHVMEGAISTIIIYNSSVRKMYPFSFLVIHCFTYINMYSWILFYSLGYNPNIAIYFVAQIIPAMATGTSDWLLCSFDMPLSSPLPPPFFFFF